MKFRSFTIIAGFLVFSIYAILILSLVGFYDIRTFGSIITSTRTLYSIYLSIICAFLATLFTIVLAIPSAYGLSRFDYPMKGIIDTLLELPLILSPMALGATLLIFFNTKPGRFIEENITRFVFEVSGIVLAQFVSTLGIATRILKTTFDEIPERYESVARSLGASHFRAFCTVTFPLSRHGILTASIISFGKSIGEFGATVTLCGSMPMKTETMPIAIFLSLSTADIERAVLLITILVIIALSLLTMLKGVRRYV